MQNIEFGVVTQKTIINVEEGYPLKTFAPVDENGEIANNGDAYGIVIDALGIGEVKQLVVMTAGCIDKICAEQHYGESYSAEAISALENIVIYDNHKIGGGGGGGGGWPSDLPKPSVGGYGYTEHGEQTVLVDNESVTTVDYEGMNYGHFATPFYIMDGAYTVIFNGTEYNLNSAFVELDEMGLYYLGELAETAPVFSRYPFLIINAGDTDDTMALYTESAGDYEITVIYGAPDIIHKIDEKYLPENLATKSDVEATQEVLDGVFSSVATFTFDKQTSGRDTFVFNAFDYYKISDFNPAPEDVISFKGTRESGDEYFNFVAGHNCVDYGLFIVVASAGRCSLPVSETTTLSFTAPSAGLYATYRVDNPFQTAGTAEFTLKPSNENYIYIDGVFLKSSTTGSTKKFRITVDDRGTISATEVV